MSIYYPTEVIITRFLQICSAGFRDIITTVFVAGAHRICIFTKSYFRLIYVYLLDSLQNVYTIRCVKIEYDPVKNDRNIAIRGLSFDLAEEFDLATALIVEEMRGEPPELRYRALGVLTTGPRVHALVFTLRGNEDIVRVISFRKANQREVNRYEQYHKASQDQAGEDDQTNEANSA